MSQQQGWESVWTVEMMDNPSDNTDFSIASPHTLIHTAILFKTLPMTSVHFIHTHTTTDAHHTVYICSHVKSYMRVLQFWYIMFVC